MLTSSLSLQAKVSIQLNLYNLNTMSCKSILLPLLLERVGVRRIKSISYIPHIPAPSALLSAGCFLKGEGAGF
jgi:hypothetical protein